MKPLFFSHNYYARSDIKISYLIAKEGLLGYGLFWCLVEIMHEAGTGKLNTDLLEGLSFNLKVELEQIKSVIKTCIEAGLFVVDGNHIISQRVIDNLIALEEYSEKKADAGRRGGIMSGIKRSKTKQCLKQNEANEADKIREDKIKENNIICLANAKEQKIEPKGISVKELYSTLGLPEKTRNISKWQDEASNAIKYFTDIGDKSSSVFKCFKENNQKARTAFSDCKELGKNNVNYFFKIYNELIK